MLALPLQHSLTESVAISRITSAAIATRNNIEEKRTSINKSIQIQGEVQNKYTKCPRTPTDKCHGAGVFFVWESTQSFGNFATADFHQIWSRNVIRCPDDESGKSFSKIFTLGVICPQNLTSKLGQTGTSLRAGYVVVKSQRVSEIWSTFSYDVRLRSYGAAKFPNFRILAYFTYKKTLKTYLPVTSLQRRTITIFPCDSRRFRWVHHAFRPRCFYDFW